MENALLLDGGELQFFQFLLGGSINRNRKGRVVPRNINHVNGNG
jgi:hypothetical protein